VTVRKSFVSKRARISHVSLNATSLFTPTGMSAFAALLTN
jgi:hypothetical protein